MSGELAAIGVRVSVIERVADRSFTLQRQHSGVQCIYCADRCCCCRSATQCDFSRQSAVNLRIRLIDNMLCPTPINYPNPMRQRDIFKFWLGVVYTPVGCS